MATELFDLNTLRDNWTQNIAKESEPKCQTNYPSFYALKRLISQENLQPFLLMLEESGKERNRESALDLLDTIEDLLDLAS